VEVAFGQSPFVNAVCAVATGNLDTPLAIVNADNNCLEKWAKGNGVLFDSLEELTERKEM